MNPPYFYTFSMTNLLWCLQNRIVHWWGHIRIGHGGHISVLISLDKGSFQKSGGAISEMKNRKSRNVGGWGHKRTDRNPLINNFSQTIDYHCTFFFIKYSKCGHITEPYRLFFYGRYEKPQNVQQQLCIFLPSNGMANILE